MILAGDWGPMHYDVAGPAGARVVAFTRGIGMDHTTLDEQVAGSSDPNRLVVCDVPGRERSCALRGSP